MTGPARFLPLALGLLAATSAVLVESSDSNNTSTEATVNASSPSLPTSGGNNNCRHLDAALRWYGRVYLFSGSEYMALDDFGYESYVGDIGDWDGLPVDIDAAFQWTGDHTYYFMKGDSYYTYFTASLFGPWSSAYEWDYFFKGGIDAAANRRGESYFFKGSMFTAWYSTYCGISHISPIPSPLPHDIDAAFEKHDDWLTMVVVKGDTMWEWGPGHGEIYGPFPVSDHYTLRSWTLCPLA